MHDKLKAIRLALFARRNGVVADALRTAGDPHELIMGCPLSDIIAVARELEPSAELAEALWADTKHRECRLLAPMLYPIESCDEATALRWCHEVLTEEEADVLCHRLLRHLDCAVALMESLLKETPLLLRYTAFRLMLNLAMLHRFELNETMRELIKQEIDLTHSKSMPQLLNCLLED